MVDATVPAPAASAEPESEAPKVTDGFRRYAMVLLLLIYILNFVDRSVVNILAEPIKEELGLLDWQLGLMTGLAFALFYTILGLPIAQLAERSHRPAIIAVSLAVWSGFTAISGFATNFVQLILARIGVGVGEAGCTPAAHSLISDYVPKAERASALAFYSMGTPLGGLVGMAVGGLVADTYGWRMAFIVCGVPGILFALIAGFTLIEPRMRKLAAGVKREPVVRVKITEALALLAKKKTFWLVAGAAAVKAFIGYGHAPFTASFFFRNHTEEVAMMAAAVGLKSGGFVGLTLGLVGGLGGAIGAFIGGWIADRFARRDLRGWMSVPGVASLFTPIIYIFAVTHDSAVVAIVTLGLNAILGSLWYGPVYATAQTVAPLRTRATASAIMLFVINLIGLGLGPVAVGALSDVLAIGFGLGKNEGVRWALILSACLGFSAFFLFWQARKTIREEVEG